MTDEPGESRDGVDHTGNSAAQTGDAEVLPGATAVPGAARVTGALLVVGGVACLAEATTFDVAFMTDPVGPKALPYLVGALLTLGGLHTLLRPPPTDKWPADAALVRVGAATAAFVLYALALPFIGFFTSTTLVVAVLARLFGAAPIKGVPAAALLSGALWLIFVKGLGLLLPIGDLWIR